MLPVTCFREKCTTVEVKRFTSAHEYIMIIDGGDRARLLLLHGSQSGGRAWKVTTSLRSGLIIQRIVKTAGFLEHARVPVLLPSEDPSCYDERQCGGDGRCSEERR